MKNFAACAVAMFAAGCANALNYVGEKQRLGPPDVFQALNNDSDCAPNPDPTKNFLMLAAVFAPDPEVAIKQETCKSRQSFKLAYEASTVAPTDAMLAQSMFKAGANASDSLCFTWFAQLDGLRRASRAAHDTIAGLGALTNAVQVLTGVEPAGIGIATAAFNQAGLGFDALERNYLMPSDLAVIYNALKTYRERTYLAYIGADGGNSMVTTYYDADRYLRAYHDTCSSNSIQYFILSSVSQGGASNLTPPQQAAALMQNVALEQARLLITGALNISTDALTADDVGALAGYVISLETLKNPVDGAKAKYRDKHLTKTVISSSGVKEYPLGQLVEPAEVAARIKGIINESTAKDIFLSRGNTLAKEFEQPPMPSGTDQAKKP